ncbi:ATP-binding protein [Streptomyces sp. B6B3]|uniref:ATP-binding protein n=1 Tax=Streptomyces sp. B6B3 TaxID=3153570 RepID=UPI00325DFB86
MQVLEKQLEVGPEPTEVGRARRWVRAELSRAAPGLACPDEAQTDVLVLLVSELVTNAVVHTGRPALLRLSVRGPRQGVAPSPSVPLRLEVLDASSRAPLPRRAGGEDTGGRGLELVELLADRWGWQREGRGKRVWCELDCRSADDPAHEGAREGARDEGKVPATY